MARSRALFVAAIALCALVPVTGRAGADTASENAARMDRLESRIGEASRSELTAMATWQGVHDRRVALDGAVARLDARIAGAQARVHAAQVSVSKLAVVSAAIERQMERNDGRLRMARVAVARTAVSLYATGNDAGIAYSAVVLDGSSPRDMTAGTVYLENLSSVRRRAVVRLSALQRDTVTLRRAADRQRARVEAAQRVALGDEKQLSALRAQRAHQRDAAAKQEERENAVVAQIRSKKSQYQAEYRQLEESSAQLQALLADVQAGQRNRTGFHVLRPVPGGETSPFGWRYHPVLHIWRLHAGEDLAAWTGEPVHAAASGTVVYAGWENGYGLLVVIDHHNGYATAYGHNSKLYVSVGEHVTAGETISAAGMTGVATGPHVHFEVRHFGTPINPVPFFN